MTAKTYMVRAVIPLVERLKAMIKSLVIRYFKIMDSYHRLSESSGKLYRENENLAESNDRLREENAMLREKTKEYALIRKVFGRKEIDGLAARAKEIQQEKRQRSGFKRGR